MTWNRCVVLTLVRHKVFLSPRRFQEFLRSTLKSQGASHHFIVRNAMEDMESLRCIDFGEA